jgi:Peptidase of plants and bacteria
MHAIPPRPCLTALSTLAAALLMAACGGGSGGGGTGLPGPAPNPAPDFSTGPSMKVAAQACIQGSPYTVTLLNSEQLPNDTVERMVCTFADVYPKIMALLSNPDAPKSVVFEFQANYPYPAANTNYKTLTFDIGWMKAHPLDTDIVIHESTHLVQAGRGQVPSWVLEGTAHAVLNLYGRPADRTDWGLPIHYDGRPYTDGYGAAAAFFKWVDAVYRQHQPRVIEAIYASANDRPYQDSLWVELTGKTVETLWSEYLNQPIAAGFTSGVRVFMASDYGSYSVYLERGRYDLADLLSRAVPDNEIASVRVPAGYSVKAYADPGFAGAMVELTADTPALPSGMTRQVSSLIVE